MSKKGTQCLAEVANKWNDPLFLLVTMIKPDTHSDFARPFVPSLNPVCKLQSATMDKVGEKLNTMNLALKHVNQIWECSGKSNSGFTEEYAWVGGVIIVAVTWILMSMSMIMKMMSSNFRVKTAPPNVLLICTETSFMAELLTFFTCGLCSKNMANSSHWCSNYTTALALWVGVMLFLLSLVESIHFRIMILCHFPKRAWEESKVWKNGICGMQYWIAWSVNFGYGKNGRHKAG